MQSQAVVLFFVALAQVFLISAAPSEKRTAGCSAIKMIQRKCWGGSADPASDNLKLPVNYVFFDQTGGETCSNRTSCCLLIKGINSVHTTTKNFSDIGYNFLIGGDGIVYTGVGWDKVGNHTKGWNRKSISIAFIGNYTTTMPSQVMLDTAKNLIECSISMGKIDKTYGLYSYVDGSCKASPAETFNSAFNSWQNWHKHGTIKKYC